MGKNIILLLGWRLGNIQNVGLQDLTPIIYSDISDLFAREKINATKANTISRHNLALMQFSIEVTNLEHLSHLLTLIQQVPNVISAQRRY